ncbi:MAG: alanine dehydrogenase [bacterium]|nr:alanine dehydrogenase [bacterium]
MQTFQRIGLLREVEGPENPGAMEKRVALAPTEVQALVKLECRVFVEEGAGLGVGFSDAEYIEAGAEIQTHELIYSDKDLLIKFKGVAYDCISRIDRGATLLCMAHNASFPDRAQKLLDQNVNVIAMEEIVETPKHMSDDLVLSKTAMRYCLHNMGIPLPDLEVNILGYSSRLTGAIRRAGNRNPKHLKVFRSDVSLEEMGNLSKNSIVFYDSYWRDGRQFRPKVVDELKLSQSTACLFDLREFEENFGIESIQRYRETHPPYEFGMRRIQALHETGRAGARYGLSLLKNEGKGLQADQAKVLILGYGNTGTGAMDECLQQGVRQIEILGRRQTAKGTIEHHLRNVDLVINGAEQPAELRGKNYLITRKHARELLSDGTVVIDLIGGSASNRSPVENIIECTYMTQPYFKEDGVLFSALWGWPMMGFMRESAIKYSRQILDVLVGTERLIDGIENVHHGIKPAILKWPCFKYSKS